MVIYFDSKTGNVARFIEKVRSQTNWQCVRISESMNITEEGHLVTYTTRIGSVPDVTLHFVERNRPFITSVSSSGNRNWGPNFALAANILSERYTIPLLLKFELSGLNKDVNDFIQKVNTYERKKMDTPQQ